MNKERNKQSSIGEATLELSDELLDEVAGGVREYGRQKQNEWTNHDDIVWISDKGNEIKITRTKSHWGEGSNS